MCSYTELRYNIMKIFLLTSMYTVQYTYLQHKRKSLQTKMAFLAFSKSLTLDRRIHSSHKTSKNVKGIQIVGSSHMLSVIYQREILR